MIIVTEKFPTDLRWWSASVGSATVSTVGSSDDHANDLDAKWYPTNDPEHYAYSKPYVVEDFGSVGALLSWPVVTHWPGRVYLYQSSVQSSMTKAVLAQCHVHYIIILCQRRSSKIMKLPQQSETIHCNLQYMHMSVVTVHYRFTP